MLRRLNRHARLIASAPAAALLLVALAACASLGPMTPEQRACCQAMAHECGEMAIESSCCTGAAQQASNPAPSVRPDSLAVDAPQPIAVLVAPAAPPGSIAAAWTRDNASPSPPGVPTYLFVSSFRI